MSVRTEKLARPDREGESGVAAGVMTEGEGARRGVDGEAGEAGEQLLQDNAGLQPSGGSAQAVVRADGESHLTGPAPPAAQDVELIRAGTEHARVPVGRPVQQQDLASTGDPAPVNGGVAGEGAGQALDWRGKPEQLLDCRGQQLRPVQQ